MVLPIVGAGYVQTGYVPPGTYPPYPPAGSYPPQAAPHTAYPPPQGKPDAGILVASCARLHLQS
jgi:hypothetical protein